MLTISKIVSEEHAMSHTGPGRHRKSGVVIGAAAAASGVFGITGALASMPLTAAPLASVDITTQQPGPKIAAATFTSADVSRPQPPTQGPKTVVIPGTGSGDGTGDGPKAIVITDNPGDGHGPKAVVVPGGDPGNGNGPKTVVITGTGSGDGTGPKAVIILGNDPGPGQGPKTVVISGTDPGGMGPKAA